MTPERFRTILDTLGWSRTECARIMRRDPRQVRRWAAGSERDPMDQAAADWLELQAANPPPEPPRFRPE